MATNADIPQAFQHRYLLEPLLEWLKVIPIDVDAKRAMLRSWADKHQVTLTADHYDQLD